MTRTYKTEGIILKRFNLGEADRILTIYTKHYGKIRTIAKGVRKLTSRKGGNVELFNHLVLFLVKGRNLDILSEVQVVNSFRAWRKDLKKVGLAYYFCELVDKLTPDQQANRAVFELLRDFLGQIDSLHWQNRSKNTPGVGAVPAEKPPFKPYSNRIEKARSKVRREGPLPEWKNRSVQFVRSFEEKLLNELGFGVPPSLREGQESLKSYIEEIVEKKINSLKITRNLD